MLKMFETTPFHKIRLDEAIVTLTVEQSAVVESPDRHLIVLAGPGSGKTHVIIERVSYLFANDLIPEPYGLLAITFTNAAANEMRSRMRTKGFAHWDRVWIGTFHGFGNYVLRCYGGDVGIREDFDIISYDEQNVLCNQVIEAAKLGNVNAANLVRVFENLKRQGIYPDQQNAHIAASLRIAYSEYQKTLSRRNLLDFGDLVALTLKLLRESALPKRLFTNFFQYVIVDEFQDTDTQQLDLTQILAESAVIGSLIVADDDQSIYAFRGADRTNVYEIEERLGASRVVLGANFRSDQVIVEAAQAVISYEESRSPRSSTATSTMRGHLYMAGFADPEAEANQVEEWVKSLMEQQAVGDLGEIAVITRDRWRANQVLQAFDNGQVPWFDRARLMFQDSWETSLGLAILAMAVDLDSSEGLHRVMTAVEDSGLAYNMRDEDALDTARRVRQLIVVNFSGEPGPHNAMEVLRAAGIDDIIERNSWSTTEAQRFAANLDLMMKEVVIQADEHDLDLLQIINRLAGYGAVQVMSGHGSKGKEFSYVFLVGLEDDVLPNYRTHGDPDAISEERRVFYVSLTRAKKAAYLTYARQRVMPWGETRAVRNSRFLESIPQKLFTTL